SLLAKKVVLTDGAWGTEFQKKGLPIGASPDIWNLTDPQKVEEVARSYVEAGSEIILTNTFGGNGFILRKSGQEEKVHELNREGVRLSKKAAGEEALVFASMGPSGIMLMMGEVTPDELYAAFEAQAIAMAEGGADGIVVETMCDPEEAALAVRAAKTTGLPVVGCMVFDSGKDLDRTMMGTTVEEAAEALLNAGADIVGSNCGKGIEGFLNVCQRLHAVSGQKVWIKANRGLPEVVHGTTQYAQTPEMFASFVPALLDAGAGFIGGCCGTSPEVIAAVKKRLQEERIL
ncbi:MAG: homocysteine S-methyltransferase family protein, partial [Planctomycetia bacterium]|nr:homocysteine S-methyltransferase family protein [Planctomycetia bacterium]